MTGCSSCRHQWLLLDSNAGPVGYKSSVLTTKPPLLPTNSVLYKQIKELESRSEAAPRARPKTAAADAKAQKQVAILTDQLQDKKKDIKELQAKIAQLQEDVKAAKSDGAADVSYIVICSRRKLHGYMQQA